MQTFWKQIFFLLSLILVLISCTDRNRNFGGLSFEFINTSDKNITILAYWTDEENLTINAKSSIAITKLEKSGISSFANEVSPLLNINKKIAVVFNDKDTVIHYNDSSAHTGKYLNLLSDRCLYNNMAYVIQKKKPYETATYTFTQKDYEFATQ